MIDPGLLNSIANPQVLKMGNPLDDASNALNAVLLKEKVTDLRGKRRRTDARNSLAQMPGVMNDDGSVNRPVYRKNAIAGGYADLLPEQEDQWMQEDKAVAELGNFKADSAKTMADTGLVQTNTIAKKMESLKPLLGTVQNAQQYVQLVHSDPDISRSLTERQMGPEQLMNALSRLTPQQFQQFILAQRVGDKESMQNHFVTANKGGTGGIYQMPQYGDVGTPKEVANWKVTENPNSIPKHWVQDVIPGTNQVINKVVKPGDVTNTKPPAQDPAAKAEALARTKRAQAASAVAAEVKKFGGGQVLVHPETGDIEIQGVMPMSPTAQRRLDLLAGELGGQLEMVPGQNPRVVLYSDTTLGQVQSTLRMKQQDRNSLTWEVGANGVRRMVPKAEGVIQMPDAPKTVDPVKLRAQARSQAIAEARAIGIFDQATIDQMADGFYQQYLDTPGAGYGGKDAATRLADEMRADREARRGVK